MLHDGRPLTEENFSEQSPEYTTNAYLNSTSDREVGHQPNVSLLEGTPFIHPNFATILPFIGCSYDASLCKQVVLKFSQHGLRGVITTLEVHERPLAQ